MPLIKKRLKFPLFIYFVIPIIIIGLLFGNIASASVKITSIEFIGAANLPTGLSFQKTELGGLSGITYDAKNDLYYAISDDRGQKAPARLYTLKINLSKGKLTKDGVVPVAVTPLLDENNQKFLPGVTDTEGIALTKEATVFISSEGDVQKSINPFIKEFSLASGQVITSLPISDKFLPDSTNQKGIRNNLGFESLTLTPDNQLLFTATENALIQDGTAAKPSLGTNCRILQYSLTNNQQQKEFLYQTEPVTPLFDFTGRFDSGLVDLLALDNQGHLLSLERTFTGLGFAISLFQISLENADDIHKIDSLSSVDTSKIKPAQKKLLLDLQTLDVALDNIEGLTLGAKLPNGQTSLILISDNNFNKLQSTQILAFKLKLESSLNRLLRLLRVPSI
ncbi:esterase-like activity of phytase family protein [Sphaerospermopsis aphanizomenoides BCCUSP55]|uniref:esterase-like activity of phytase family protein n=1 Tax=Sphaerospermopsis aphanizomenoides TaxID=459663 RepID=UPI0019057642|nr:esterase-like activity of phytase family protein [Sphaerospermopsis aphanizomenoides]MBK1987526.1 esterase-like activity of phytase family protein [Sphaerospermopsis aphanizomenoides BCCUSP55]